MALLGKIGDMEIWNIDDPREVRYGVIDTIDGNECFLNRDMTHSKDVMSTNLLLLEDTNTYKLHRNQIFVAIVCNPPIGNSKEWRPYWVSSRLDDQYYKDKQDYENKTK